jgi:hypothetical protein
VGFQEESLSTDFCLFQPASRNLFVDKGSGNADSLTKIVKGESANIVVVVRKEVAHGFFRPCVFRTQAIYREPLTTVDAHGTFRVQGFFIYSDSVAFVSALGNTLKKRPLRRLKWIWGSVSGPENAYQKAYIPLFDRNHGHPSVPTCPSPGHQAMARSRMAEGHRAKHGAPKRELRCVLDGAGADGRLAKVGRT